MHRAAATPAHFRPTWLRAHHQEFDVIHVHAGLPWPSTGALWDWLSVVDELKIPLVLTIHELHSEDLDDQGLFRQHMDLLVKQADRLITMTAGAAAVIDSQWPGHAPVKVIPHPHMVPLDYGLAYSQRPVEGIVEKADTSDEKVLRVGVHFTDIPANTQPVPLIQALALACQDVPGARLLVHLNADALDAGAGGRHVPLLARLLQLRSDGLCEVHQVDEMNDHQTWAYLQGLASIFHEGPLEGGGSVRVSAGSYFGIWV